MPEATIKEEAHKLVEKLPEDATWEDLQYQIYVRQAIEGGLRDLQAGRTTSQDKARKRFAQGGQ